jgi:hypothetical protein
LARRTRRDLSDKKVRRIIRKKQKASPYPRGSVKIPVSKFPFLKYFLIVILFFAVVFLVYQSIQMIDFENIWSAGIMSEETEQAITHTALPDDQQGAAETEIEEKPDIEPVPQRLQVEVLNGCGVSGLANTTTNYLRDENIDVVYKGNYQNFNVEKSQVIDRTGDKDQALKVAEVLGVDKSLVSTEVDDNKQLAVTIILGKDYKKLTPFQKD